MDRGQAGVKKSTVSLVERKETEKVDAWDRAGDEGQRVTEEDEVG